MNQAVMEIQHALRTLSFTDPRLLPVNVNGFYGPETTRAVTVFQTLYGLPPTGEVDSDTWNLLKQLITKPQNVLLDVFPHPDFVLRPEDDHELKPVINAVLLLVERYYSNLTPSSQDATQTIKDIQALHQLEQSGIVDQETWNVIARLFNHRQDTVKESHR